MPLIISEYTKELCKTNNDSKDDIFLAEKRINFFVFSFLSNES
jgi:hypothetical protein